MTNSFSLKSLPPVSGISDDTRNIKPGYLFVAVRGENTDGHDLIEEAVKKGAKVIVGEKSPSDISIPLAVKYVQVKDSRQALGELASDWYGNPSQKLKVIGVTGTDGKTTTSSLIYHFLKGVGKKVGLVSTVSAVIGDKNFDTGFHVTNPDALALQDFLAKMVEARCEYAVLEVTSHGIAQKRIAGISFDIAVLTNITHEHLDYHGSFENYLKTKVSLLDMAKNAVVNSEDNSFVGVKKILKNKEVIFYKSEDKLKGILPGDYNTLNLSAAIAAVGLCGVTEEDALRCAVSFKLPVGRLEKMNSGKDFDIYVDFAHTPNALENALKYLRTKTKGKLISVFGSASKRDVTKRPLMGKAASLYADKIVLTAEDPRGEDVEKINAEIKEGIGPKAEVYSIPDRQEAIIFALRTAKAGDVVGIFGKGHEKSMNLDGVHESNWSDQKAVEKAVKILSKA